MNIQSFCFFLLMLAQGATVCQSENAIVRLEFSSIARGGFHEQIIITQDTVRVVKEEHRSDDEAVVYSRKLNAKEWTKLMDSLSPISLKEIPTLPSPTMHRTYDGAAHSIIVIVSKDSTSWQHGFDDENPHKKLQPLMAAIREAANRTIVDK